MRTRRIRNERAPRREAVNYEVGINVAEAEILLRSPPDIPLSITLSRGELPLPPEWLSSNRAEPESCCGIPHWFVY